MVLVIWKNLSPLFYYAFAVETQDVDAEHADLRLARTHFYILLLLENYWPCVITASGQEVNIHVGWTWYRFAHVSFDTAARFR